MQAIRHISPRKCCLLNFTFQNLETKKWKNGKSSNQLNITYISPHCSTYKWNRCCGFRPPISLPHLVFCWPTNGQKRIYFSSNERFTEIWPHFIMWDVLDFGNRKLAGIVSEMWTNSHRWWPNADFGTTLFRSLKVTIMTCSSDTKFSQNTFWFSPDRSLPFHYIPMEIRFSNPQLDMKVISFRKVIKHVQNLNEWSTITAIILWSTADLEWSEKNRRKIRKYITNTLRWISNSKVKEDHHLKVQQRQQNNRIKRIQLETEIERERNSVIAPRLERLFNCQIIQKSPLSAIEIVPKCFSHAICQRGNKQPQMRAFSWDFIFLRHKSRQWNRNQLQNYVRQTFYLLMKILPVVLDGNSWITSEVCRRCLSVLLGQ